MKSNMVSYTRETMPKVTEEEIQHLKELAELPDNEIDYSDIPPLTDDQLRNARRGMFYRPAQQEITARVDADVLDWLKTQGEDYSSRLNAILRREMLASHAQEAAAKGPAAQERAVQDTAA